jgi:hypothetical protein
MDGGDDGAQGPLLFAYSCMPYPLPFACINHPKSHVVSKSHIIMVVVVLMMMMMMMIMIIIIISLN